MYALAYHKVVVMVMNCCVMKFEIIRKFSFYKMFYYFVISTTEREFLGSCLVPIPISYYNDSSRMSQIPTPPTSRLGW